MKIVVGSISGHKLEAVIQALDTLKLDADVSGIQVDSGQSEEPVGFGDTFSGALTRAQAINKLEPDCIAIGIESGVIRFGTDDPVTMDIAFVVILTPGGKRIITTSTGVRLPEEYVNTAVAGGQQIGVSIATMLGGDPTDPHVSITDGKVTRTTTLVHGLTTALAQLT